MKYTNDEADRAIRQRNYYLTVYVLPLFLIFSGVGLWFWASKNYELVPVDQKMGFSVTIPLGAAIFFLNSLKWLKMPDGSYYYRKAVPMEMKTNIKEPLEFLAEYKLGLESKLTPVLVGLGAIIFGVYMTVRAPGSIFFPASIFLGAPILVIHGIRNIQDKSIQLKIAKTGVWTKKLGFVHWDEIFRAEIVSIEGSNGENKVLEIWINGTASASANEPDDSFSISFLKDHNTIDSILSKAKEEYHNSIGKTMQ